MNPTLRSISEPPGRRERRKAETRRRLLDAARSLFVRRGYEGTRPQDIAREADLATGTFYVHFADRREIFHAFTEQAAHELSASVRRHAEGAHDFEERLRRSFEAICAFADANPGVLRAALADTSVITAEEPNGRGLLDRLATSLAEDLRAGMAAEKIREDYDPTLIAYGIVGLVQHTLAYGFHHGVERAAVIENLTRFCVRALTHDAATKENPA